MTLEQEPADTGPVPSALDQPAPDRPVLDFLSRTARERAFFFRLADQEFALKKGWCGEVFPLTHVTRVPMAPPVLSGVVTLRGSLVLLLNLAKLTGMKQRPSQEPAFAVRIREQRMMAALGIDESLGFEPFSEFPAGALALSLNGTLGTISRDGTREALVLNVPFLFETFRQELRRPGLASSMSARGVQGIPQQERG